MRSSPTSRALTLWLLLASLLWTPPLFAQQTASFVAIDIPMADALDQFVRYARADLLYDPALVEGMQARCTTAATAPEDLLRCLLKGTPLDFVQLSTGTFVLIRRAADDPLWGHLVGLVVDGTTGESLPYAHVFVREAHTGTATTPDGRFTLGPLLPGSYHLQASFIGYEPQLHRIEVQGGTPTRLRVQLQPSTLTVAPVTINGLAARLTSGGLGRTEVNVLETETAGAEVVSQSLRRIPGVRVGGVLSDVNVQGGASGDHQFRLDGAPLFVPLNIAGQVGPFSPLAIERIVTHKAGFAAREGSHLSGVIAAEHALGAAAPTRLDLQVTPLSIDSRFLWKTGQPEGFSMSGMVTARSDIWGIYRPPALQSLLDTLVEPDTLLVRFFPKQLQYSYGERRYFLESREPTLHFTDLHAASRLRFGPSSSLYLSGFRGYQALSADLIYTPIPNETQRQGGDLPPPPDRDYYAWVNEISQARYERVFSARVLGHLQLRRSHYELQHALQNVLPSDDDTVKGLRTQDDGNRLTEQAVSAEIEVAAATHLHVESGLGLTRTTLRFFLESDLNRDLLHNRTSDRLAGFVHLRYTPRPQLLIEAGVRATSLLTARQGRLYAEPRLSLRYDHTFDRIGTLAVRASGGLYRQFLNQFDLTALQASPLRTAVRFWLPVDGSVAPPKAYHLSLEASWHPTHAWSVYLEAYRKWQTHLLVFDYRALRPDGGDMPTPFPSNVDQDAFLESARGEANGVTAEVERTWSALSASVRYEYNFAVRQSPNRFDGLRYPTHWNEPHRLSLQATATPWAPLTVQARTRAVWQRPWGFAQVYYDYLEFVNPSLRPFSVRQPGAHVLPPFYQTDVSVSYALPFSGGTLQLRTDVLNVFDRRNVAYWELEGHKVGTLPDGSALLRYARAPQYLLPRMILLSAHVTW